MQTLMGSSSPPVLVEFLTTRTPGEVLGLCARCRRWRRVAAGITVCPICGATGPNPVEGREP